MAIKNYLKIMLLVITCGVQAMEEEKKPSSPTIEIERIGRSSRPADLNFVRWAGDDSIQDVSSFYIGAMDTNTGKSDGLGYQKLLRLPRVKVDNGIFNRIRCAFNGIASQSTVSSRLDALKDLFTHPKNHLNIHFDFSNINLPLPLFVSDDVKIKDVEGDILQFGDTEVMWKSAEAAYLKKENRKFFIHVTPLQFAAIMGDPEAITWFLEQGADPSAITKDLPVTPLQLLINLACWEEKDRAFRLNSWDGLNDKCKKITDAVNLKWASMLAKAPKPRTALATKRPLARYITTVPALSILLLALLVYWLYNPYSK